LEKFIKQQYTAGARLVTERNDAQGTASNKTQELNRLKRSMRALETKNISHQKERTILERKVSKLENQVAANSQSTAVTSASAP